VDKAKNSFAIQLTQAFFNQQMTPPFEATVIYTTSKELVDIYNASEASADAAAAADLAAKRVTAF
jgi:hypothetical protein